MEYPVDILAEVDPESLEQSAKDYMSKLLFRNPEIHEYLKIRGSKNLEIGLCNVSFVPLYGVNIKQKILALFSPEDRFKAVGLYLLDQWWSAEEILKTADSSRSGLIEVRTPGERIVLYVLNRIIYRTKERDSNDVPFLCHEEDELAKIFWKNGEAIGFYSVKPEGELCSSFLTQHYQLPVMDTIFIRKHYRGRGYGLQMLEDFVDSFRKDFMGLKYPLSPAMYRVCKKYLSLHPENTELLLEIEGVGSPFQRTQIAKKLQVMELKGHHQVVGKLNFDTEDSDVQMEVGIAQLQKTMEYTEVEEIVQINIRKAITTDVQDTPVTTRARSRNLKQINLGIGSEETAEKIIRVEGIEPDVQCTEHDPGHEDGKDFLNLNESELKDTMDMMTQGVTPPISAISHHYEEQTKIPPVPTDESEKERVVEISPFMVIQTLKSKEDADIETEKMLEKAVEVKDITGDVEIVFLDGRKTSEKIVQAQQQQKDVEEVPINEDTVDMRRILAVESIVDTEQREIYKEEAGNLKVTSVESEQVTKKDTLDETGIVQDCLSEEDKETEDEELRSDNEKEKVSTIIQQEENLNMVYRSASQEKHVKRKSNYQTPLQHSKRLHDQAGDHDQESKLTERVLRSSSKKTLSNVDTTQTNYIKQQEEIKQVEDDRIGKELNQRDSQVELRKKEHVEGITENESVEQKVESVNINTEVDSENLIANLKDNEKEAHIEKDCLDQHTADQNFMELRTKMETSAQDENKMDNKLQNEEQEKVIEVEKVGKTTEANEDIRFVDISNTEASEIMIDRKALEPSTAEHVEEEEEERGSEPTLADDDNNTEAVLKQQKAAVVDSTESQQVVEMIDNDNIEKGEVRHDVMEIVQDVSQDEDQFPESTITDENPTGEVQEEESMEEPYPIQSEEPKRNDCMPSYDYNTGKTNKDDDDDKIVVVDVHEDVNTAEIEAEGKSMEQTGSELVEEQKEEAVHIVQHTKETVSTLKLQKGDLENLDNDSAVQTYASKDAEETSQPESNDDGENTEELNQKLVPIEKTKNLEMTENGKVEIMNKIENNGIEQSEETMETTERVISTDIDKDSELITDENKMNEFEDEKVVKEPMTIHNTPNEDMKNKDRIDSCEDDEGLKPNDQIDLSEEDEEKRNDVTPLRRSRRLKHQAAEKTEVIRSATKAAKTSSKSKAIKEQAKTNQAVDDPEVAKMQDVVELHIGTGVGEKIESASSTTDNWGENLISALPEDVEKGINVDVEHVEERRTDYQDLIEVEEKMEDKINIEVEEKTSELPTAEAIEEQEEETITDMVTKGVKATEETTSVLKLTEATVMPVDINRVTLIHDTDAEGTSQHQKEEELEVHKSKGPGPDPQSELTEQKEVEDMTKNENTEEIDEKLERAKDALNDEDRVPGSAVTNKENMEEVQKETNTVQDIPGVELNSRADIESDQADEDEEPDVPIELDGASLKTLRHSRRLQDEGGESELIKRGLRRSRRLRNKGTPQRVPDADDHKNIKSGCTSHGNKMEENIKGVDPTEQDEMAQEDILHGKAEQICPPVEKSVVDVKNSEVAKEVENEVQEEGTLIEMVQGGYNQNVIETTLEEAFVVLVDVKNILPNLIRDDSSNMEEMGHEIEMNQAAVPEELTEEFQTDDVEEKQTETVNPTEAVPMGLNTLAKDTAEEQDNAALNNLKNETTNSSMLEEEPYNDETKVEEGSKTGQVTQNDPVLTQDSVLKCSGATKHVRDISDLHNTELVKDNISVEETKKELAIELIPEEDQKDAAESVSMLKLHEAAVVLVDFQRRAAKNETNLNEMTQSLEVGVQTGANAANEEKASAEMHGTDPLSEQKEEVELGADNEQDILVEKVLKDDLKDVEARAKSESTVPVQGDIAQKITQDEDIPIYSSRNLRRRTLPVKATPEKSRLLQNISTETEADEEASDKEAETAFSRHLRQRTITPGGKAKCLTHTHLAELEMEAHGNQVHHEIEAVQSTEEAKTAVEDRHETSGEEIPAVSELAIQDQHQDENAPGSDAGKVEEATNNGKDMVKEAVDHKEVETAKMYFFREGDPRDESKEKEVFDEMEQAQERSENSSQENDQQYNAVEETLLEKSFENEFPKTMEEHLDDKVGSVNMLITKAVPCHSEEDICIERRVLRKRKITSEATPLRRSKRLRKQNQDENVGQAIVWPNTEDSTPIEATETSTADVNSPAENKTTDEGKDQKIDGTDTVDDGISHKEEDMENAKGEETSGNLNNSQEKTMTDDVSKKVELSEVFNVLEDTDAKLFEQEENGEEHQEEQVVAEERKESENNALKADKVTDESQQSEDIHLESEQSEKSDEEITEASLNAGETFTLELDEELDSGDAETSQVVEDNKVSFQENKKEITNVESEAMTKCIHQGRKSATASRKSTRRSMRLLLDIQSELEDNPEAEEVKKVFEDNEKHQQKRKAIKELTPRRSKRLARAKIV